MVKDKGESMQKIRKRQVHLDFHTSEYIEGIAKNFNKELFVATLEQAAVNSITCFARCHHGWLYYPSKLQPEMIHPHLANPNLLLEQIEACHSRGIEVPIYTTVQWDGYVARQHPEWLCVDSQGAFINSQGVPEPHFYYSLCLNSGYRDYFTAHLVDLIEVVGQEQIDGVFMDILFRVACDCQHCQKEMLAKGIDHNSEINRLAYSEIMLNEFKTEIADLIRQKAPKATIFYNGSHVGYADKQNLAAYSHLELESLPSGGWGYDHFPITMRYARNLGKEIIGMTGKFHTYWGDFHSLKNQAALEFECFNMLALGAGCSIGDQLHPDGQLSSAGYELIGNVYRQVAQVESACEMAAIPEVEIGVLTPEETWVAGSHSLRLDPSLIGANRLLQELNYQFDIIDSQMDFSRYKVLILPDVIAYTPQLQAKLKAYTADGGAVIGSYRSLIDEEHPQNDWYGIEFLGDGDFDRDFIMPNERLGKTLPQEEFVMYLKGAKVALKGADLALESVTSFFYRQGDTFCSHQHAPATRQIGAPAATRNGQVSYFAHPLFRIYRKNAPHWVKAIFRDALEELMPRKLLTHDGPSTFLTTVNRNSEGNRHIIHGLHYITQKNSEDIYTIDEVIPLHQLRIKYDLDGKQVKSVRNIVTGEELLVESVEGYLSFVIPRVEGHIVIEVVTS